MLYLASQWFTYLILLVSVFHSALIRCFVVHRFECPTTSWEQPKLMTLYIHCRCSLSRPISTDFSFIMTNVFHPGFLRYYYFVITLFQNAINSIQLRRVLTTFRLRPSPIIFFYLQVRCFAFFTFLIYVKETVSLVRMNFFILCFVCTSFILVWLYLYLHILVHFCLFSCPCLGLFYL